MKTMNRICTAFVLTLTLTLPGLAGEIHTPGVTQPPPPTQRATTAPASHATDADAGLRAEGDAGTDFSSSAAEAAWGLLQTILSLF